MPIAASVSPLTYLPRYLGRYKASASGLVTWYIFAKNHMGFITGFPRVNPEDNITIHGVAAEAIIPKILPYEFAVSFFKGGIDSADSSDRTLVWSAAGYEQRRVDVHGRNPAEAEKQRLILLFGG